MELPEASRRLFPGYSESDLAAPRNIPFVIGRLLEDGDSRDLSWLCGHVPESDLGAWLETRGGRQLSTRSRAFWEILLETKSGPEPSEPGTRSALWPL